MNTRRTAAIAFATSVLVALPALADDARDQGAAPAEAQVKSGGTVLSIHAGFGFSFAGTENDGDRQLDGYEEMDVYSGAHAELSVFVGRNFARGRRVSFDMGYHGHLSINDVDVIQRHQFAVVLAGSEMFGLVGVGGSVLHDVGFEAFAPFVSFSVIAGYRFGPVSVSIPIEAELPIVGSHFIQTVSFLVGYAAL